MKPLLKVESLVKRFATGSGMFSGSKQIVQAVSGVSFELHKGQTLGLVGESGCGKTTVGRMTLRLIEPTEGKIWFDDIELTSLKNRELNALRPRMQIIFQDPYSSLNPKFTIERIIGEALMIHKRLDCNRLKERVVELMEQVGLSPDYLKRYPHEFSGGQRQRIGIARALSLNPEYIVCDEPVSALDVSIQAQIINLLKDLQDKFHLSLLFISHDLNVVKHLSNHIAVMYLGRLVEVAPISVLNQNPAHPYTKALMAANPVPDPRIKRQKVVLEGDVPSPIHPPSGCRFHPRCPEALEHCKKLPPRPFNLTEDHTVECHLFG
tara:strand:- start:1687 stop:2652 length:966 start_codon:yes stop_codon:yes gene_type:complete